MWDYTEKVKEHFLNPRNVGEVENPDGVGEVGSLACGDALKLTFKLDEESRIEDVKFQTFGCASAIASSSALTELIKGKTLEEAENITNKDIADYLGGLPDEKMHCSVMGKEALEAAIENYRTGETVTHQMEGNVVCTCFGITDTEIEDVVRENNLETVEQVTNYCKAGGGCGGCTGEIERIIQQVSGEKKEPREQQSKRPKNLTNIQKIQLIQEIINEQVRPSLKADGGDLDLIDVVGDDVIVAFRGMCANCKMAELTLTDVVQAKLREYVSEDINVYENK
ncbi:Fe-S cluster assembly protein NifU [Sedimentisphaera salicampi]|uniref:Fe-S cluster assembly protein NifU n=1 Tax=Sedimentisphaera salicampi TaxID=1941349 RepID=UPI000B9ABEDC|nr:Fe-S cluster assembly protein NifU [Sedimentisphaera salicampi]OXU14988.1 NifU-like protein [Sedimentisphaera salicampi]